MTRFATPCLNQAYGKDHEIDERGRAAVRRSALAET